jgi:4-hydroxybutyrate dehydrogenase / sulfolactaldehyde 3-reductase
MNVAFIGLGTMGGPMALNILRRENNLAVFDVSERTLRPFRAGGCRIATSPADAARDAQVVMLMLPDGPEVKETLFGAEGVCAGMKRGGLVIDCSTISAEDSRKHGDELAARGYRVIDAPIGRTPRDAQEGTLLVIAGGAEADIREARPLFEAIGNEIIHAGPRGCGIKMKLVNNYMSVIGALLTAEALTLAKKAGLDRDLTVKTLSSTTAGRGQLIVNYPKKVLAGDVTPDFTMRMAHKDISHALSLGAQCGSPLLLGAITREMLGLSAPWGRASEDWTAALLLLEDISRAN